jgi:hypothetical protein
MLPGQFHGRGVIWGVIIVNRKMMLCGLAAVSLMLPACATITRGTSQKFDIDTTPTAANVELSTGQTCVSPCKLKLKRKTGFTVTAKKDGFEPAKAVIESRIRGGGVAGGVGNVVAGGLIGIAVDASSGAMNDLTPNPLHLTLNPVAAAAETSVAPVAADTAVAAPASEAAQEATTTDAAPAAEAAAPTGGE